MANFDRPKCGVCCDSGVVPKLKRIRSSHKVYKLAKMVPCPYCSLVVKRQTR